MEAQAMNKTELELLERARCNRSGVITIQTGYITSRKRGRYGHREWNAARKLVEAGKLQFVRSEKHTHQLSHRFGADHWVELVYRLTDK
jgi:hypothetical protein